MTERLPYGLLAYDLFQGEYVDDGTTETFATEAEAKFEAGDVLSSLQPELSKEHLEDSDPTYHIYVVGPDGDRDFCGRA